MAVLVVFAGGRSVRFGRDKCTYVHGGRRLVDYVVEAASPVVDEVYIAAGQNAGLYRGEKVLADSPRFSGPLAAVDAAVALFDDVLLFAPCDAPFLRAEAFRRLLEWGEPFVAWVYPNGRVESTIFKASPAEARRVLDFLARHRRSRIDDLFRTGPTRLLSMARHGVDPAWFLNINRPEDFEKRVEASSVVFSDDVRLEWPVPPLYRWLEEGDAGALEAEFLRYVELGLFSLAAHVAKDLAAVYKNFGLVGELLYDLVDIEKAR